MTSCLDGGTWSVGGQHGMHYKMKSLCDYNSYFNWVTLTSTAKEYKSLVSYCVLCTHAVLTAVLQFDFESEEGHEQNDAKLKEPSARTHPPPPTHTHTLSKDICATHDASLHMLQV